MSAAKHTAGPLHMRPSTYEPEAFDIVAPNIGAIGIVKHVADAARIVQCCNAHDELVALLKRAAAVMPTAADCPKDGDNIVNYTNAEWNAICRVTSDIRAALTKATGGAS